MLAKDILHSCKLTWQDEMAGPWMSQVDVFPTENEEKSSDSRFVCLFTRGYQGWNFFWNIWTIWPVGFVIEDLFHLFDRGNLRVFIFPMPHPCRKPTGLILKRRVKRLWLKRWLINPLFCWPCFSVFHEITCHFLKIPYWTYQYNFWKSAKGWKTWDLLGLDFLLFLEARHAEGLAKV